MANAPFDLSQVLFKGLFGVQFSDSEIVMLTTIANAVGLDRHVPSLDSIIRAVSTEGAFQLSTERTLTEGDLRVLGKLEKLIEKIGTVDQCHRLGPNRGRERGLD